MTRGDRLPTLKARRESAGLRISDLARLACCSDLTVLQLERGGNCDPDVTARILNVLGASVAITSSSVANPTVVTTATNTFKSADTVTIAGHTSVTPDINGERVATVTAPTTFTVPVNVSDGGVGGTAILSATTLGRVALQ
jgi:transcriptional regulator with XRE-family HTH domain